MPTATLDAPAQLGYVHLDGTPSAPHATQLAFHAALDGPARFACLLGGWGAGKSLTGRNEALKRALLCPGSDGLVVRRTYQELTDSTWPECVTAWAPILQKVEKEEMTLTLQNKTRVRFRSARHEGREDPTKFGSVPYAWFWMEEGADLDYQTWAYLKGRMRQGGFEQFGYRAWITTNPPDNQHWIYREFIEARYPDHALFKAPTHENRQHLPAGYIERLEAQYEESWVRRYLLGDFGFVATEWPVYADYREALHVAKGPILMIPGAPIIRGWDFGVAYAACVVGQVTASGHLNLLAGYLGRNEGMTSFAQSVQVRGAANGWEGPYHDYGDPAGWQRDISTGLSPVQHLVKLGITMLPGEQDPDFRIDTVNWFLKTLRDGRPMLQLDPGEDTRILRDGLAGGYHFRERPEGQIKRPAKNQYSHPMNALEYACSRLRGRVLSSGQASRPMVPRRLAGDWASPWRGSA